MDVDAFSTDDKKALSQIQKHNKLFLISSIKQGQKLVLSDALAVQSQGYQGPKVSSPKVVLGSQK